MADKYLIHGAAFCGDGTASNEAASAGAPGAWNDIAIFHNTNATTSTAPAYGTLNAGDRVFIRSKTSAGADITITLGVGGYLGKSGLTDDATPVTWVLDNGQIWAGIDGLMTIAEATFALVVRMCNHIIASGVSKIKVTCASTSSGHGVQTSGANILSGWEIDVSNCTSGYGRGAIYPINGALGSGVYGTTVCNDFTVKCGKYSQLIATVYQGLLMFNDPSFIVDGAAPYNPAHAFQAYGSGFSAKVVINGGSVTGSLVTTGFNLFGFSTNSSSTVETFGFQYPKTINLVSGAFRPTSTLTTFAADAAFGSERWDRSGFITSRSDNSPPLLNATLPTSGATPWSWRAYPSQASPVAPLSIRANKAYMSAAAVKTITQEILVADTLTPTDMNVWLTVEYIDDTTGLMKRVTSQNLETTAVALTASAASWSSTTWGMVNLLKKKLVVTTPTAIKQDTPVITTIHIGLKAASVNDIFFIDPDVQLS